MRTGFDPSRGAKWDRSFGDGVYFGFAGDEKSRRFYQRQGGRTKKDSIVLNAGIRPRNPAEFNIRHHNDFHHQAAEKLGGIPAVKAELRSRIERADKLAEKLNEEHGWGLDLSKGLNHALWWDAPEGAYQIMSAALKKEIPEMFPNEGLSGKETAFGDLSWYPRMSRDDPEGTGFWKEPGRYGDGGGSIESRVLGNMLRDAGYDALIIRTKAWGGVGGNQIVVFDPKAIRVRRPLP